jgi:hypothetical protein
LLVHAMSSTPGRRIRYRRARPPRPGPARWQRLHR